MSRLVSGVTLVSRSNSIHYTHPIFADYIVLAKKSAEHGSSSWVVLPSSRKVSMVLRHFVHEFSKHMSVIVGSAVVSSLGGLIQGASGTLGGHGAIPEFRCAILFQRKNCWQCARASSIEPKRVGERAHMSILRNLQEHRGTWYLQRTWRFQKRFPKPTR